MCVCVRACVRVCVCVCVCLSVCLSVCLFMPMCDPFILRMKSVVHRVNLHNFYFQKGISSSYYIQYSDFVLKAYSALKQNQINTLKPHEYINAFFLRLDNRFGVCLRKITDAAQDYRSKGREIRGSTRQRSIQCGIELMRAQ